MSDILINACDENWWYGDTVRDFNAHRFLLGTASPVFHKILYSWEDDDNDKNIAESCNNSGHQKQRKLGSIDLLSHFTKVKCDSWT